MHSHGTVLSILRKKKLQSDVEMGVGWLVGEGGRVKCFTERGRVAEYRICLANVFLKHALVLLDE